MMHLLVQPDGSPLEVLELCLADLDDASIEAVATALPRFVRLKRLSLRALPVPPAKAGAVVAPAVARRVLDAIPLCPSLTSVLLPDNDLEEAITSATLANLARLGAAKRRAALAKTPGVAPGVTVARAASAAAANKSNVPRRRGTKKA